MTARFTAAAGVLFTNLYGEILLLETTYKKAWDIPGGVIEHGEPPRQAARREVFEETGINTLPGRLLVVDFVTPKRLKAAAAGYGPGVIAYIFAGPVLDDQDTDRIVLQRDELKSWAWSGPGTRHDQLLAPAPILRSRLAHAQRALALGTFYDLVNGQHGVS